MELPQNLIDFSLLLCEKVLHEADGVMSLIRLEDFFYIPKPDPDIPRERQAVKMSVVVKLKFSADDNAEHIVKLELIRPSQDRVPVGEMPSTRAVSKFAGLAKGINVVAQIGVIPKETGTHELVLMLDGIELHRIQFTLRVRESGETEIKKSE